MQNYQSITLDVNKCVEYEYINAKQGDHNSRFLKITLTENGNKIEPTNKCTASFRCLKPDGRICVNKAVINSDGTLTVTLTDEILSSSGTVRADIALIEEGSVLSSATFFIIAEACPVGLGNNVGTDELLILVEKAQKTANDVNSRINLLSDNVDKNVKTLDGKIDKLSKDFSERLDDIKDTAEITSTIGGYNGYSGYNDILGLQIDYANKKHTRLAGAVGLNAGTDFDAFSIYSGMKRCNVDDNGNILAYYGDSNFVDTDSSIQVMVYIPKFYYKVVPLKLDKNPNGLGYHMRKANYYITDTQKAGFKLHPAFYDENGNELDYFLYSAYEGALYRTGASTVYNDAVHISSSLNDNDLIISRYNTKPISGQNLAVTRARAEQYCSNRGNGWHCETIKALSAIKLLMMIEYGTMNLQTVLGKGISIYGKGESDGVNYCAVTGSTRTLGNNSGQASVTYYQYYDKVQEQTVTEHFSDSEKVACSYRGIENPYGNLWKYIQGVNVWGDGTMAGGQPYISEDFNYNELSHSGNYEPAGFSLADANGYISAMGYGSEKYDWLFLPSEAIGNSSLPVGDNWYTAANVSGHRIIRHGGAWNYGDAVGLFAGTSNSLYTAYGVTNGCRLIYLPQN